MDVVGVHANANMNLAPFQQVQLGGAKRFEEFHFHFGIALGVLAHECRKHAFDHCGVAATFSTPLSPRRRSSARSPSAPTWPNRLRQSPSNCSPSPVRDEPATDTIEKHEAELMFKIADL